MGRILNKKFRHYAEELLNKYGQLFTTDYEKNRKILEVLADFPSKRVRNMIAGYITRKIKKVIEL
ncbi:MAG TPA: 30S ribosomal protein S17e [Candidatus Nanopusillus sp.]|nr:30S ribosomal protein S17e [Candidatus Nanopusillus sp.]